MFNVNELGKVVDKLQAVGYYWYLVSCNNCLTSLLAGHQPLSNEIYSMTFLIAKETAQQIKNFVFKNYKILGYLFSLASLNYKNKFK